MVNYLVTFTITFIIKVAIVDFVFAAGGAWSFAFTKTSCYVDEIALFCCSLDYPGRISLYGIQDVMCTAIFSNSTETEIGVLPSCIESNYTKVFVGKLKLFLLHHTIQSSIIIDILHRK